MRSSRGCRAPTSPSSTKCRCAPRRLRQLPQLKMIAVAATGYDVVDIAYCKEHGIAVANIRNYAMHTVPEHAFAHDSRAAPQLARLPAGRRSGRVEQSASSFAFSRTPSATCTARRSGSSARARSARAPPPSGALSACACCLPIIRRRRCRVCTSRRMSEVLAQADVHFAALPAAALTRNVIDGTRFAR